MIPILLLALDVIQFVSIILAIIFFLLGFKLVESNWSYKISKPYQWEEAIRKNVVSVKLRKIERFYRDKVRFYTLWLQIERIKAESVRGAFAEVGVYKGETARMIHEMDPTRKCFLFDTFQGFAEGDLRHERKNLKEEKGIDFSDTSLDSVKHFIQGNENVIYFPGYFPDSVRSIPEEKFSLVHLDADLYQPTIEGLRYFYPKLSGGGVLLVHDYNHNWEGVRKAVDEFVVTIDESLILIPDWQGSAMIIKNKSFYE